MELGLPEVLLALVTVLSPLLSAVAIQTKWSPQIKNSVAFGVSILIAAGYLLATGAVNDWSNIPAVVLAVYGLQQLIYMQFLRELSKKVEAATSVEAGQAIVVEENKPNVVVETGQDEGQVVVVEEDATPVAADYEPEHRGDTEPRG